MAATIQQSFGSPATWGSIIYHLRHITHNLKQTRGFEQSVIRDYTELKEVKCQREK